MTSNNVAVGKITDPNPYPNNVDNSELNQTNNVLNQLPNNAGFHKKKLISAKSLIIIGASIILVAGVLTLILVLTSRNSNKKIPYIFPTSKTEVIETTDIQIETTQIIQINATNNIENETLISYEEAEKIIGLEKTKENHELFNKTSLELDELISHINSTNFSILNQTNIELNENINFLNNTTDSALIVAKKNLDLYIESLSDIPDQINNLTKEISKRMIKISESLNQYKKGIENSNKQYEENIRYLAIPILENSKKLRNLEKEEELTQYKEELEKLDTVYNEYLISQNEEVGLIQKGINIITNTTISIVNKGKEVIDNSIIIIGNYLKESTTIRDLLIILRDLLASYHDELDSCKKLLSDMGVDILNYKSYLNDEESEILDKIKKMFLGELAYSFVDNILVLPINAKLFKLRVFIGALIYTLEDLVGSNNIYKMTATTSLDLLFIVDITGSMYYYLEEIKDNIIEIVDGIIKNCPGINVNLGFIGYRDFDEGYVDVDFMQNHTNFKKIISRVYTDGGGWHYPDEDVEFAFELALKKKWTSNAKLAVLVADAPGHNEKYGGYEYSSPKRRDIDEMVSEMFGKGISLFCLKIRTFTDLMYQGFKEIYNKTKPINADFQIIDDNKINSFTDAVMDYASQVYIEQREISVENCLLKKETAVEILKTKYGIDNENPDDNLRFILGPCNPVLLVPGVYATKLKVEINCKEISKEEKNTVLKDIRLYCGNDICSNENNIKEEHNLLFSLLDDVFGLDYPNAKKHGSCLGYISNYFQNENECPKVGDKSICNHSKYIKVAYYGGTSDTLTEGRCGVEGITNVVQSGDLLIDAAISTFAVQAAGSFYTISKNFIENGYKEGFSLGAVPNDYRRYLKTNNFASEVFKYQINKLYENTGKPVVIIGHSYGTLLTLTNLLKNEKDKTFLKKIKKFVAMAPPFSGSAKLLDVFLHGNADFTKKPITEYPLFGQYLQYKSLPTTMELRPLPMAAKIFIDPEYKELGDALRDRLEIEMNCYSKNCDTVLIKNKTEKFDKIFKGYFPSLLDSECAYESNIGGSEESLKRKCFTYIYNVGECPTIITETARKETSATQENFENKICNKYGKNYFYQGECNDSRRNCLDKMYYSDKCPNPFNDKKAVDFLLKRFNNLINKIKYGKIDETYFDDYETIKLGVKKSIEYQKNNTLIEELPVPPVDTDLLYASFYKTISVLVLDDNNFTKQIEEDDIFEKGGDNTVQTWSSLLTGLKWIYDKKKQNLTQKINLIEYCSRLGSSGQYKYSKNKEQNFAALKCDCLNETTNEYGEVDRCSHASMLKDKYLFEYLYSVVNNKENIDSDTNSKKDAVKKYNKNTDYTQQCNEKIKYYLDTVK